MKQSVQVPEEVLEKFILGFEGSSLPEDLRDLLETGLAGVILFPRNFSSAENLRSLTEEIQRAAGQTALIGIDQEGGTRFSLPAPFTQWVSAEELGRLADPGLVERQSRAIARELRAVGCNLNFAPMLDLNLQPESPVTKGRSFGSEPKRVALLGAAFARGLATEAILACAKHFPGHGDTVVDPHHQLPVFHGSIARLREMELIPFAETIAAQVPVIMTAHISLPEVDTAWPASLSPNILGTILRREMKFRGAILADDLGMGALASRWGPADTAVQTFRAGSDLALLCHDSSIVKPAIEGVESAFARGEFHSKSWEASRGRIANLREAAQSAANQTPPLGVVRCSEHKELVREIREKLRERSSRP